MSKLQEPYLFRDIWVRGKQEEYVVKEQSLYKKLKILPGDKVLDVGAHIGCSAREFIKRGASLVHSYEPEVSNALLFKKNTEGLNAKLFAKVVVDSDLAKQGNVKLYLSQGKFTTTHSILKRKGRIARYIPSIGLFQAVEGLRPEVIKCDIEGGELEMLPDWKKVSKLDYVRSIAMEIHYLTPGSREKGKVLKEILNKNFTEVQPMKYLESGWNTCIAIWEKKQ